MPSDLISTLPSWRRPAALIVAALTLAAAPALAQDTTTLGEQDPQADQADPDAGGSDPQSGGGDPAVGGADPEIVSPATPQDGAAAPAPGAPGAGPPTTGRPRPAGGKRAACEPARTPMSAFRQLRPVLAGRPLPARAEATLAAGIELACTGTLRVSLRDKATGRRVAAAEQAFNRGQPRRLRLRMTPQGARIVRRARTAAGRRMVLIVAVRFTAPRPAAPVAATPAQSGTR